MMRSVSIGPSKTAGVSTAFFAMKYGTGEYNLLACSLRKTSLSSWKVSIEPNIQFMKRPTRIKKLQPATFPTPLYE